MGSKEPAAMAGNKNKKATLLALFLVLVAVVITAVFIGLWADKQFNTSPVITIILLIISVPVSLVTMFAVVQSAVRRIRVETSKNLKINQNIEENKLGNDKDK